MARERGTFNFSASLEVKKQGALDSRLVIQTYAELTQAATWADTDNKIWLYDGMIVSVVADSTSKNGVYMLTSKDSYNQASSWTRIDAKAAAKVVVENTLTSNSAVNALSANQGRILKGMIDAQSTELDQFKGTKGQANGLASLDENGKIPASQLNGELGRVVGIQKFVNAKSDLGSLKPTPETGDKYYVKDDDKIYTYRDNSFGEGETPRDNTIYNHRLADSQGRTNVLYRWDGSTMVEISASIALGETEGTAYDGKKGHDLKVAFDNHAGDKSNPHDVTATQLGIDASLVGKTAAQLPISTATQAALDKKVDKVSGKSLVLDTEIAKLADLPNKATLDASIADAKKAVDAAKTELKGTATSGYDTLGEIETALKKEVTDRTSAVGGVNSKVSALDTAVSAFKSKTVATTLSKLGNDTSLPTTKAVVDYITTSTNGVAKSMTYTVKSGDANKMELKLIAVDGSTLSTVELDKENFISNFINRNATEEDHTADKTIAIGDPILVVTTINGTTFRVNLKSLVDIYKGQATNSITTTVSGYTVKADLRLDATTQNNSPVKLSVGSNGLSADVLINSTSNGTKGISLTKTGSGLAAELKIDSARNTSNGVSMSVGSNGLSMGIVWTEL